MILLLVDDEHHVLEGIATMVDWKKIGITRLLKARNGLQAWQLYQSERPDLLMTDVYMPKMTGLALVRKIREADPDLPVIILSGYDEFAYAKEAIDLDVARYVLKPSTHTELEEVIADVKQTLEMRRSALRLSEQFERQLNEALPLLREQFLYAWITRGTSQAPELELEDRLAFYQVEVPIDQGAVLAHVQCYREPMGQPLLEKDWQRSLFSFGELVKSVLTSFPGCYPLGMLNDRMPIVFFGADGEQAVQLAQAALQEVLVRSYGEAYPHLHIGLGRWYAEPALYSRSFRESIIAIERNENEHFQQVFAYEDQPRETQWPVYPAEHTQRLLEALMLMDMDKLAQEWEALVRIFAGEGYPLGYVQTAAAAILNELIMKLMELDGDLLNSSGWLPAMNRVQQCRTKEQVFEQTKGFLDRLLELLYKRSTDQANRPYTDAIKKHIAEHYAEPISFSALAKQLHLTRNYLSYVFKRDTGMSFLQYVTQYRIKKAQELLLSGQYMVYEVGEKVGYPDPAYFSRVFKSVVGMSPVDFGARRP